MHQTKLQEKYDTAPKRKLALVSLLLASFMALMDTTIVNIVIPDILKYFSVDLSKVSWVTTGYNLAFGILLITASKLADQFGRKKVFIGGLIAFTLTSLLCGISTSIQALIVFRILQGLTASFIVPVTMPIAIDIVDKNKKGLIIGIWGAVSGFAAALGPVLGGILSEKFGWQSIFFVNIPIGIITLALATFYLRETYDHNASKKIDYLGSITLTISLFCLTFSFAKASELGWSSQPIILLFIIFLATFLLFLFIEKKAAEPIFPLIFLKVRTFTFSSLTLFILGVSLTSGTLLITIFLTNVMNFSSMKSGLIISSLAFSSMFTSIISGKFSDKLGGVKFSFLGMLGMCISTFLYATLNQDSSLYYIILLLCLTGLSLGMVIGPAMGSSIRQISENKVGIASGTINMMRAVGQALGIALLTTVLTMNISNYISIAKNESIEIVNNSKILKTEVKSEIVSNLKSDAKITPSSNSIITDKIKVAETKALQNSPEIYHAEIKKQFKQQEQESLKIFKEVSKSFSSNIDKAFSDTFILAGILSFFGIITSLFSDVNPKRKYKIYNL
ncbi:MFS transporter [Bacillus cereus]|uniref:MFS transporter n=1 Tax=Bacillus cereus TaxID=1396 RepID=UPI0024064189|nr:MFS transporter [Bacillus cereus]MDF9610675.1 MFS transporter [Bacillus cereus]